MKENENPLFSHLVLKSVLSFALLLLTEALAIVLGYLYRENKAILLSILIPVHVAGILSFAYLWLQLFLAGKKRKELSFLKHLMWIVFFLVVLLSFLESFLITG